MLKTAYMVVAAALFSTGVAKTADTISARTRAGQIETVAYTSRDLANVIARAPWAPMDPADSLYREARAVLARGDYARAADLFRRLYQQFPNSDYAGESLYYRAFAEYRIGGTDHLRTALSSLTTIQDRFPSLAKGDAKTLRIRVCGELARQGDEGCAAEVSAAAKVVAAGDKAAKAEVKAEAAAEKSGKAEARTSRVRDSGVPSGCASDDDDDDRVAALNALLQMDAERALPILKTVLARRDPCSVVLRRKAVFLVSQKRSSETADILLGVVKNDPDEEVREQGVFWLSQVPDERAVTMLQQILATSNSEEIKNKALFALSQHRSPNAAQFLRDFALRENESDELRGQAIFWLGQRRSTENADFLRSLYTRIRSAEVKEKILFSLSQQRGLGNDKFLLDIAKNSNENIELRKKALFWAGQGAASADQLIGLYSSMTDSEMREQLIFVYSQRREPAFVDKMIDIAKNDKDPELRKKAIFWLGQSHDPRVQQFLVDLINK
ncbi:MAG TPA: HEAT repeat domain-containing protein [Gemmatimonadaceae bacterium]|nr:HEAT repeat domain-containing protein [Gemmatimonadaceae bacterium]